MAFAMYSEPVNGASELSIVRESQNTLKIRTVNPLSDDQMEDIYWSVLLMMKTGKTLKEMLNVKKGKR